MPKLYLPGLIDYKEVFRWVSIPGPIYRIWLIKKQFFLQFSTWNILEGSIGINVVETVLTKLGRPTDTATMESLLRRWASCCLVAVTWDQETFELLPGLTKMAQERLLGRMVRSNYFSDLENCFQTNSSWWWPWWMSSTWPPSKILLFPPASKYLTRLIFLMDTRQYGVYHYSRYR